MRWRDPFPWLVLVGMIGLCLKVQAGLYTGPEQERHHRSLSLNMAHLVPDGQWVLTHDGKHVAQAYTGAYCKGRVIMLPLERNHDSSGLLKIASQRQDRNFTDPVFLYDGAVYASHPSFQLMFGKIARKLGLRASQPVVHAVTETGYCQLIPAMVQNAAPAVAD